MRSKLRFGNLALAVLLIGGGAGEAAGADLVVEVSGLRNSSGDLRIALFDSKEGLLGDDESAVGVRAKLSLIKRASFSVTLHAVPPGEYAVAVYHDEDADGTRDESFLGLPKEGYGFSNAAEGTMGPPSFESAAFRVGREAVRVPIVMGYP